MNCLTRCLPTDPIKIGSRIIEFGASVAFQGIAYIMAKRIYEIMLPVYQGRSLPSDLPYIELMCITICTINTAYISLKLARLAFKSEPELAPRRYTPRILRPYQALDKSVSQPNPPH